MKWALSRQRSKQSMPDVFQTVLTLVGKTQSVNIIIKIIMLQKLSIQDSSFIKMDLDQALEQLVETLPGKNKQLLPSLDPNFQDKILGQIRSLPDSIDTVIMTLDRPWPKNSWGQLLNHMKTSQKFWFIGSLGYQAKIHHERIIEISFPTYQFMRPKVSQTSLQATHGFASLNGDAHLHRLLLGSKLLELGVLGDMIYSQDIQGLRDLDSHAWRSWEQYDPSGKFRDLLPIHSLEPQTIAAPRDPTCSHAAWRDAYCHIVTESSGPKSTPGVTGKSYKPFLSGQIPLYLAPSGHLDYLERMGFCIMPDLLPKLFDEFSLTQKIDAVCDIVQRGYDFIKDFYQSHQREIAHNHWWIHRSNMDEFVFRDIRDFLRGHI